MIKIKDVETAIIKLQTSYKNSLDDVHLSIIMLHTCSIISENHYETHYAAPIHQNLEIKTTRRMLSQLNYNTLIIPLHYFKQTRVATPLLYDGRPEKKFN